MAYIVGTPGTWEVNVSGTISRAPDASACPTELWFEHDSDTASRVELINETMSPGDSLPFAHTATLINPSSIALPMICRIFGGATTTVTGTVTFTWMG
jgi:hypothetical protein